MVASEYDIAGTPTTSEGKRGETEAEEIIARFEAAAKIRQLWQPLLNDCHTYALPYRDNFFQSIEGQRKTDKMFDSTAVTSTMEFASRLQAGLTPNYSKWALLEPGPDIPDQQKEAWQKGLEEIGDELFQWIHSSNFNSESHECYIDLAVGTCGMMIEDGENEHPFKFTAVPLTQIWLEAGPFGTTNGIFRPIIIPVQQIKLKWRDAKFDKTLFELNRDHPRTQVKLIEATVRDFSRLDTEVWKYRVIAKDTGCVVVSREFEGEGSNPWVVGRWACIAGETYGRGPLMAQMPDIKTANLLVELVLENAEMAIAGLWQYEDDGTIDPNTINLVPGTMIPHGAGSKGLEPLKPASDFSVAEVELKELRGNIKRGLFDEMLGPVDKTPMSATEVHARMADMARRIGSPYGRLHYEFVQPTVQRCLYLLKKQGRIKLPRINHRYIKVTATSPLARQQKFSVEVQAIQQLLEIGMQAFGPQMVNMLIDGATTLITLADDLGVPKKIIRDDASRKMLAQQISQLAASAQQQQGQAQQQQPQPAPKLAA